MPPPSAATATTATTAIRPTSSAYSTMEAPRSVRARSSRLPWKPRTAKNAFRNSSVISSFPSLAPHVPARSSGPIWSSQCILGFASKQLHRLYGPNTLGFCAMPLLFDGDETHDDSAHQRMRAVRHVEFLKDRRQVVLGRLGADVEPLRDLAVRRALGEQLQHLELPLGQRPRPPLAVVLPSLRGDIGIAVVVGDDLEVVTCERGAPRAQALAAVHRRAHRRPGHRHLGVEGPLGLVRDLFGRRRLRRRPQDGRGCIRHTPPHSVPNALPGAAPFHHSAVEIPRSLYALRLKRRSQPDCGPGATTPRTDNSVAARRQAPVGVGQPAPWNACLIGPTMGPRTTIMIAGRKQKARGKRIFTGTFAAFSRARWRRLSRISSA